MAQIRFNSDALVLSADYSETMNDMVLPWIAARCREVTLAGYQDRPLSARVYTAEGARGAVMIAHGFTESALKFSELIHSLLRNGFSVVAYDQRGHGASWRDPRVTDLSLTHVDRFDEYVRDAEIVAEQLLVPLGGARIALSHSMGGAVMARLLQKRGDLFDRAVFSSPMIRPATGGLPLWLVKALCRAETALGRGTARALISKPFSGPEDFQTAAANGRERFDWYDAIRVATPIYQNNGPSYGWTLAAMTVGDRILAPGEPEKISCPMRVYTASEDTVVLAPPQEELVARAPQASREVVAGAKHEIYRSPDEVLFPWWRGVLDWIGA